ncbi:50S ribosomal protein L31 [Candidatus Hepatincolaceae symbiont of Richtersius coronifer]
MKKGIHPDYHEISIQFTDGSKAKTRSTWGKTGDVMILDIDTKTHPAWTGNHKLSDSAGRLSKFNARFGNFGIDKKSQTQ